MGTGTGEGWGAHTGGGTQQEEEGVSKHSLDTPSPSVHPRSHANVHAKGGVGREEREGGAERWVPLIYVDALSTCYFSLFLFMYICFLMVITDGKTKKRQIKKNEENGV